MSSEGNLHVGTSGWAYNDWRGPFYPEDLHKEDQLEFYSKRFRTAEINKTFNQFPFEGYIRKCNDWVSDDFCFSVCGNRRITHESGLKDLRGVMSAFFSRLEDLDCLDVVVWEIPEDIEKDEDRLMEFLEVLPMDLNHGIEFRNQSWHEDSVYQKLEDRGVSCVTVHQKDRDWPELLETGPFSYIRFRESANGSGSSNIDQAVLEEYAEKTEELLDQGRDVYLYFLNVDGAKAIEDANRLNDLLSR